MNASLFKKNMSIRGLAIATALVWASTTYAAGLNIPAGSKVDVNTGSLNVGEDVAIAAERGYFGQEGDTFPIGLVNGPRLALETVPDWLETRSPIGFGNGTITITF